MSQHLKDQPSAPSAPQFREWWILFQGLDVIVRKTVAELDKVKSRRKNVKELLFHVIETSALQALQSELHRVQGIAADQQMIARDNFNDCLVMKEENQKLSAELARLKLICEVDEGRVSELYGQNTELKKRVIEVNGFLHDANKEVARLEAELAAVKTGVGVANPYLVKDKIIKDLRKLLSEAADLLLCYRCTITNSHKPSTKCECARCSLHAKLTAALGGE